MPPESPATSNKDAFQRLLDGLQTLMREHVALARAEMKEDVRGMGREAIVSAAGLPGLLAGYLLLMFAIAYLLSRWMPQWAAFGVVAVINLIVGAAMTGSGARKLAARKLAMTATGEEIRRDKEWLASLKTPNGRGPGQAELPPGATERPGHRRASTH
jgi:uncharacterized membrane protein YqjE